MKPKSLEILHQKGRSILCTNVSVLFISIEILWIIFYYNVSKASVLGLGIVVSDKTQINDLNKIQLFFSYV